MKNVFSKISITLLSLVAISSFTQKSNFAKGDIKANAVTNTRKAVSKTSDHFLGIFNDYNGALSNSTKDVALNKWSTENFELIGIDDTSSIGLKFSAGRYRTAAPNNDNIELGRYDDAWTSEPAKAVSIEFSEDEDFKKVWEDVGYLESAEDASSRVTSNNYYNSVITTSYVSDIQDITLTWNSTFRGKLYFIYQLADPVIENGEDSNWHLILSDNNVAEFATDSVSGGSGSGWNNCALFTGDSTGDVELHPNGFFAKNLKGRTAKVGLIQSCAGGGYNDIKLTSFVINKTNSIKALVDAVNSGVIDPVAQKDGYELLVRAAGYKLLQLQSNEVSYDESDSYFETFNQYYYEVEGENLRYAPKILNVSAVIVENAFPYDHKKHSPVFYFKDVDTDTPIIIDWELDHYSSDNTGYYSTEEPTFPAWYSLSYKLDSAKFTLVGNPWIVFHIDDYVDTFVADWKLMRASGTRGICDYNLENGELADLLARFENFNDEDKQTIRNTIDTGDVTIGETIDYINDVLKVSKTNQEKGDGATALITRLTNSNTTLLIVIIAGLVLITFAGYTIVSKKRFQK